MIDRLRQHWEMIIAGLSIFAIIIYFILRLMHNQFADAPLLTIIAIGGTPLLFQILLKLFKGDLGADSLAAIAIVTGFMLNEYLAATLIILMLSSGQTLESYAMRKASSVLEALAERMPNIAHRKIKSTIEDIPLNDVRIDDDIIVYPHETCPVDGIVKEGHGSMDESYLSGEPYQISKAPGSTVLSGAINGESLLIIQATKLPSDSRFSSIVKVLAEAEQKRPNLRRLGDQIGAIFAPIALLFALAAWYFTGDGTRFLSVIVIATPCPLLIAIPITLISAISMAAKQSIIIKDPTVLERLPTCRTAIFDKTGTLTYGKPSLSEIICTNGVDKNSILQQVASIERYSKHPLSHAIVNAAEESGLALLEVSHVSEKAGQGLLGMVRNHNIFVTHRKKIETAHPDIMKQLPPLSSGLECIILVDNQYAATFRFKDIPRKESASFIEHLSPAHQFTKIMLVSGDRESEVQYLGTLLKLTDIHASQSPEQKLDIVREEQKKNPTLFMGDGINDAPALTAATVGIAFGQYSNVTSEAAGAVIMDNSLSKVDELIHLSLLTRKIALQSAVGGMLLSIFGMSFAAAGMISPVQGALLQEVIDILAMINALRLTWKGAIDIDLPTE